MLHNNFQQLKKFIAANWCITIHNSKVIRNSDKIILELTDIANKQYILKGERSNAHEMHQICHFANELQNVLPTVHYYLTAHSSYTVNFDGLIFTLETKLNGLEIDHLKDEHIKEIAINLGKMHRYSLQNNLTLNKATSWSMFGGNKTDAIGDYDENELCFKKFELAFYDEEQLPIIKISYENYRQTLLQLWSQLPKAATQGDFCYYNMLFEHDKMVGLFDYNLAGDEVLLNECVAVGVYLSWHVSYKGKLSSFERFTLFLRHYHIERQWTELEKAAFPLLFPIIRAFRYDRVEQGIAQQEVKGTFIKETKEILEERICIHPIINDF